MPYRPEALADAEIDLAEGHAALEYAPRSYRIYHEGTSARGFSPATEENVPLSNHHDVKSESDWPSDPG